MRIVPGDEWRQLPRNRDGLVARSEQPELPKGIKERRNQRRNLQEDSHYLEKIALDSRVLIVEGISGSGKDTFQKYLKTKLQAELYMTIQKANSCYHGSNFRLRASSNCDLGS